MERDPRPSEIRARILDEHKELRALLTEVEAAARLAAEAANGGPPRTLQQLCGALHVALSAHLDMEDAILAPALRETDAFGPDRADDLLAHHAQQRQILARALAEAKSAEVDGRELARHTLELVDYLRADMDEEDRDLLNPRLLRDDLILIEFGG